MRLRQLSKGLLQRVGLAQALINDPELIFLDEPMSGLDPLGRRQVRDLILKLRQRGCTVFFSSHILSELAEMCDSLVFIDNGHIVHQGTAAELQSGSDGRIVMHVQLAGDPALLQQWVERHPDIRLVEMLKQGARLDLGLDTPDLAADVLRKMISDGLPVSDFHREARKLEDAFVEILKKLESQAGPPPLPL